MSFHGHLGTDEPPDGDYVRYIESLVGGPPEDAEQAGIELAQRLAARQPLSAPLDLTATPAPVGSQGHPFGHSGGGASGAGTTGRTPAVAAPTAIAPRSALALRQMFSRLLIIAGAALIGLGFITPEVVSMAPGFILLIAGFAVARQSRRPPMRPRSGTT